MIDWLVDRLFAASTPSQFRKRLIQLVLLLSFTLTAGGLIFALVSLASGNANARNEIGFLSVLLALNLGVATLVHQNRTPSATIALIGLLTGSAIAAQFVGMAGVSLALSLLALLSAAMLARHDGFIAINALLFTTLLYGTFAPGTETNILLDAERINRLSITGALAIVSLVARLLAISGERWMAAEKLSTSLLDISTSVTELVTRQNTAAEAFGFAAERIGEQFNASHVGIYLVTGANGEATLIAGTGKAGRQLLTQEYTVAPGAIGAVGQVLLRREPFVGEPDRRLRAGLDVFFKDSQSQMTAPILDGETLVGVIDVHSMSPDAFSNDELRVLNILIRSLQAAARITQQAEEHRRTVAENERLRLEADINQREIERLSQELTRSGWREFMKEQRAVTGLTLAQNRLSPETDWTQALIEASQSRQPVRAVNGDRETVAVPVILRGEVIGAIEVEPETGQSEADTLDIVQAVAQRLALSLDNARLLESAQETTALEQRINELVARFQSADSVDDLLQMALTELSQTLGADHAAIRLGRPTAPRLGEASYA